MLDKIRAALIDRDIAVRENFAERARMSRQRQEQAIKSDLNDRMASYKGDSNQLRGMSAAIASNTGQGLDEVENMLRESYSAADDVGLNVRNQLANEAAAASNRGALNRLQSSLAGDSVGSRFTQAGVYGAAGGGVTMGLTAAGQGVAALIQYMQSGEDQMAERQAPLTS